MACPVYLITGFLDSGKTTLIKSTFEDKAFMEGINSTLLLVLEQGVEEYEEDYLKAHNIDIEYFDSVEEMTKEKLDMLDNLYQPDQVFIEYNGTIPVSEAMLDNMPRYWVLVQILTTVDATTFELYVKAMRSMMYEQIRYADVVICNRCDEDTNAMALRGNIKAINNRAQIYYEGEFGEQVQLKGGALPFDINADVLDIKDDDYGLWYMDCAEDPRKYDGKHIILRGYYAQKIKGMKQSFILGRSAMVCCDQDTNLCGITVTNVKINQMKLQDWVEVEGKLGLVERDEGGETVVLYAERIQHAVPPRDTYVYFS